MRAVWEWAKKGSGTVEETRNRGKKSRGQGAGHETASRAKVKSKQAMQEWLGRTKTAITTTNLFDGKKELTEENELCVICFRLMLLLLLSPEVRPSRSDCGVEVSYSRVDCRFSQALVRSVVWLQASKSNQQGV